MKYKIIALVGPAGAGKDRVLREVISKYPEKFHEIISCTTRPRREGEIDGKNYYFVSADTFGRMIISGDMLEATCFNDWHYGTPISSLSMNKINIGVFNPDGIEILRDYSNIDLVTIMIDVSDKTRLIRQLNREENPDVNEIIRRFKTDKTSFEELDYDISLKNETEQDLIEILGEDGYFSLCSFYIK